MKEIWRKRRGEKMHKKRAKRTKGEERIKRNRKIGKRKVKERWKNRKETTRGGRGR